MTSPNHKLLEAIRLERSRLAQNQHVPIDELKLLVLTTYTCGQISESKACELLNVDRLEFRNIWREWVVNNRATVTTIRMELEAQGYLEDIKNA